MHALIIDFIEHCPKPHFSHSQSQALVVLLVRCSCNNSYWCLNPVSSEYKNIRVILVMKRKLDSLIQRPTPIVWFSKWQKVAYTSRFDFELPGNKQTLTAFNRKKTIGHSCPKVKCQFQLVFTVALWRMSMTDVWCRYVHTWGPLATSSQKL